MNCFEIIIKKWITMKKSIVLIALLTGVYGCSESSREEATDRLVLAGKALTGEVRTDNKTPKIVSEQQRKERKRQNTEWTPENQALHPIEYCQAQLETLAEYSNLLDIQAHKCAVAKNQALRGISDAEAQITDVAKFLEEAKRAYREAEAAGKWPVTIRGFALSKEKAQEKIVAAAEKRPVLQEVIARNRNLLTSLEKKRVQVNEEQKNVIKIKERILLTLNDLNLKKVVYDDNGITGALKAINDTLGSLGTNYDDPSVEELITPDKGSTIKVSFDAIMKE